MLPKMIFDSTCVVCSSFKRLIKHKIDKMEAAQNKQLIEYYPSADTASDFEYVDANGKSSYGVKAVEAMATDFPVIKEYMFILPPSYQTSGLKVAYKVGSVVRKTIGAVRKGCNCGKKH